MSLVVILTAAAVILFAARQSADEAQVTTVGSRDLQSLAAQEPSAPTPSMSASAPAPTSSPSVLASTPAPQLPVPVGVRIPAIGVNAQVIPVGLDDIGAMALPEDIRKVGWYELGVPPGADRGSAVLAAHRDGRVQGHGVFYDLGRLDVGNRIAVTTSDGQSLIYRVVSRELISKRRLPLEELFSVDGPPRLTLISCGGYYDRANGGYQDNVVVTAVPVSTTN